ncbi:uncharacterized protein BHQ10_007999 [Talaromyces amestolkiae]|uniref:glucan 1,3-beta-glucosidase n=1 Tax=Talaromyces amestolkiae TaxID=1196081 RepID=A0A364L846_TALAM|nr:uncharacterized protein BHQ10_007999 [Talaromyces amestolkiae]RAO71987.1 hypothetical protein BHQ10_007999 [Talaromyces amestolkiae]
MPSHSRTRDRNDTRDRAERDYYSRHRRYTKDDRTRGDEEIDYEEEDEQREEYRRRRNEFAAARRGHSRGYETIEVEEEEDDDDDDDEEEVVDKSRSRHRSVPRQAPNYDDPPRTPRRSKPDREERYRDEYSSRRRTRDKTPKAKESPATSPKKRLDREGYRRNMSRTREGSPVRERRQRPRDDDGIRVVGDRERTRDEDQDRELRRQQRRKERRDREIAAQKHTSTDSTNSASQLLSADALAKLNNYYERERTKPNKQRDADDNNERRERRRQRTRDIAMEDENDRIRVEKRRDRRRPPSQQPERRVSYRKEKKAFYDDDNDVELVSRHNQGRRLVSGAVLEEGRSNKLFFWKRFGRRNDPITEKDIADYPVDDGDDGHGGRGGGAFYSRDLKDPNGDDYDHLPFWRRKRNLIIAGIVVLLLAIIIPVAIVESRKKTSGTSSGGSGGSGSSSSYGPYNSSLSTISEDSIPASAKGTILDPFTWYDTRDFNLTYTNETVGGLSLMGLNSTWDDSAQPNSNVPALNKNFTYGTTPIRGVNIGGWLSIEPFITPSFFSKYSTIDGVIDEYTLTQKLGSAAAATIEEHYATFIQEEDFAEIAAAGLDHVRIPYSYWAVTTYDDDPYVKQISWRYLLRAIEYCRKYGLRVNLDLHGLPGSQNGYNHSGRQGLIRWLNGTDGTLNAQRSLDIHNQLSQFFAQPRYQNIITIYGLANEPPLLSLNVSTVLNWTVQATEIVQKNGITAKISMGDGFLNLDKWEYMMKSDVPSNLLLDTHQYTIFNVNEIDLNHTAKINLICNSWLPMIEKVNSTTNGFGQTICGEFSQADTDCTQYLNNVNTGTRWEGTLSGSSTPDCYTKNSDCSCASANADVSSYSSDYKLWLQTYAEAQFAAFETAMGWFYWTWQTESAPQWSYKQARAGGFLPQLAYKPNFTCGDTVPSFGSLPEYY